MLRDALPKYKKEGALARVATEEMVQALLLASAMVSPNLLRCCDLPRLRIIIELADHLMASKYSGYLSSTSERGANSFERRGFVRFIWTAPMSGRYPLSSLFDSAWGLDEHSFKSQLVLVTLPSRPLVELGFHGTSAGQELKLSFATEQHFNLAPLP